MEDEPTTGELERAQRERETAERRATAVVSDDREREMHERRADKARYLREKLGERAAAESREEE